MLSLPGYVFKENIIDRPHVLVYRAFSERLNHSVVLKILRTEFPAPEQISAYENEFEILREPLGEGIPRAFEFLTIDRMRVLVLEDIGGVNLAGEIAKKKFTIQEKTRIALAITKALASLQARGIIHRDLKPDNIVYNGASHALQIGDFGLARKAAKLTADSTLAGTLQYISPEQTGRTQNAVDYRSDYYSLGVTLYELFSGQLPFHAEDEMEWVHSHIALSEKSLYDLNPEIPMPISLIVQKLMKKAPVERYQSCLGILSDLEACLDMENPLGFRPGENDVSSEFRLSNKLYGREEEIKLVGKVLTKVVLGGKRLILVDGDPGVGKSSLVNVIKESAKSNSGYFLFGKYDQFRKDIPFSALIQAFNQLVAQILTEDEASIARWKEKILGAMGENAAIVTGILPQIELITGQVPPVQQLESNEQRQRFQQTFHAFIRACCERGRPLVIFLDDLQWADSASRSLMQMFLTEKEAESLLFIGAYRHGEVGLTHPLRQLLTDLNEKKLEIDEVHLTNLDLQDVLQLISDSFSVSTADREELAELVFEKTNGNPFFVSQFLRALYDKELLHFDAFTGWTWDLEKIRLQAVTSNVLVLLGQKIESLRPETQEILQLAACFGNYFKVEELKSYNLKSDIENSVLMQPAVEAGLLSHGERGDYKFIHDRVQEAAYHMMSAERRSGIHWQIANRLISSWSPEKVRDGIFYLVNHWNAGAGNITADGDRVRSAELNLLAATRAKDSSVYDLALNYSVAGLKLLASEDWSKYENLLKPLVLMRASCEFVAGRHDEADKCFHVALENMTVDVEKARVYRTMADLAHVQDRNDDSLRWAVAGLKLLGIKVPKKPSKFLLLKMILSNRRLLRKRMKLGLKETTRATSEDSREVLSLLASIAAPAYSLNKNLLAYVGLASVELSLKKGFLDFGGRSLFCAYLWSQLYDFKGAKESVDYILKMFNDSDPVPSDYRSLFALTGLTSHLVQSYADTIRYMNRINHVLALNGDILYSANAAIHSGVMVLLSENKLERAAQIIQKYHQSITNLNYEVVHVSSCTFATLVKALRGAPAAEFDAEMKINFEKAQNQVSPLPIAWCYQIRMLMDFMKGNYKKVFSEIGEFEISVDTAPFSALTINLRVLSAIARMKNMKDLSGLAKFKQLMKIRSELRFFKKLSQENPGNFRTAYLLLLGEWYAMRKRNNRAVITFQAAIHAAKDSEIVIYEPIANEMLGQVFINQGMEKIGLLCMRDAVYLYESWGATGQVANLTARYPELEFSSGQAPALHDSLGTISHASSQKLDLDTVLKATNTLISEMDMSRLVNKLLNILVENAGAERGVLFLMEDQSLVAKGEISVHKNEEFQLTATKLEDFNQVPKSMVTYVARTFETMVLENSAKDDRLSHDEYVRSGNILSTVCLPILAQGELRGVVYLENNAAPGVFSPERVELMSILSGQIAISLENARLYNQQGEAIRMQNELVTAHAVQEMLFPPSKFECPGAKIAGYYQPATECGGDWWSYSKIGDWIFTYIGDATGHGAPAALVTSAACSAVSVIEAQQGITPEQAMSFLNKAVCRTTKGQINMTFFVGALNRITGEFRYVRASHEPPMLLRKSKLLEKASLRASFSPLMGINGLSLGESNDEVYVSESVQLQPGDTVILYTDGLPELVNKNDEVLGERGFWEIVHRACGDNLSLEAANTQIIEKVEAFRGQKELLDDVTLCLLQFTGEAGAKSKSAA